ncbi:hypothetical protein O181_120788 [Austropuccinia psidii MF-1]|uniref:Uncharacterized protein n=1 Tax=Austropuccinia psidii MF-1 TaxID=1389203 RepID=A0A9Q3Q0N7_9BASI|nr:hypothetical protein [Austropuccinia psidii MF-1]
MVHDRIGRSYSVQPDGFGQRRGKTKSRSGRSSSKEKHLENARVSPHSPRSAPTNFDVNSEYELIMIIFQGLNHFQVEEIEIYQYQYKNWHREAKEEEWEIYPSLWQGAMNSYLHIKSFLGQEKTIKLLGGRSPLSFKDKVKKMNNWLRNQSILSIDRKKELEMTPALEKEGPVASSSSKPVPEVSKDKPKRPQKKQKGPNNHWGKAKAKQIGTDLTHKGTGSPNWSLQPWKVYSIWPELS